MSQNHNHPANPLVLPNALSLIFRMRTKLDLRPPLAVGVKGFVNWPLYYSEFAATNRLSHEVLSKALYLPKPD